MFEKVKKYIMSKKEYIILFFVTILICIPFIISKKYIAGDDTDYHMSNIWAIYNRILGGSLGFDKVLPIIANNFGYGSGIFYPCLSHVFPAFLTVLFGGNIVGAVKLTHFIVYFISSITMYKLVVRVFKNKYVAMISAIFYITFPYAITDVFTRDAFAESFIFMFIPMVVLGLYELFEGENKRKFYPWFIVGYVGLLNSHLVMAVYVTIFISIYILLNIKKVFTKEIFTKLCIAGVSILLITAPFTSSLIQHKMLKEYYVFEGDTMASIGTVRSGAWWPSEYIVQKRTDRYSTVNQFMNLLALGLTAVTIKQSKKLFKDDKEKKFFKFLWILSLLSVIMISLCPWEILPSFMIMIQFAWRIETFLVFGLSILAGLALRDVNVKKLKVLWLVFILAFNMFTVSYCYIDYKFKDYNIEEVNMSYFGMGWEKEYLPLRTTKNYDYFDNRGNDILIKSGEAQVHIIDNKVPELEANIENALPNTKIELPRIHYLGYVATYSKENGEVLEIDTYMNDMGFMELEIPEGNGTLKLEYKGTTTANASNIISIVTILAWVGFAVYVFIAERKNKKTNYIAEKSET